jgi:hypothetical protein
MIFKSAPRKNLSDMTEDEASAGIARCDQMLAKQPSFMTGATVALVIGFGAGLLGSAILLTGMAGGAMLGIAAGVGISACSAVGSPAGSS